MLWQLTKRMMVETDKRILARFIYNSVWKGYRSMAAFRRRANRGMKSPAFLFISLTDQCNLSCQGCWVTPAVPSRELDPEKLNAIITEYKRINRAAFFGLLGGEPLLYPHLFEVLEQHRDCYFQILTNGTLINRETAAEFRRLGNVTPLISIEGNPEISDRRRGGENVYRRSITAIDTCRDQRLIIGVAASICKNNLDDLVTDDFIHDLIGRGVHYLWYYIYRPVGPDPEPRLALEKDDILRLRRFMVTARSRFPIIIIDAYWDADGRALCPAAEGMSHHIGPGGDIEPCPPVQFSRENIGASDSLNELFQKSSFLEDFRTTAAKSGRGCILLEDPAALGAFLQRYEAGDSSGRGSFLTEIESMRKRSGHDLRGEEIPEQYWLYRLAKKHWFFGFGTYG